VIPRSRYKASEAPSINSFQIGRVAFPPHLHPSSPLTIRVRTINFSVQRFPTRRHTDVEMGVSDSEKYASDLDNQSPGGASAIEDVELGEGGLKRSLKGRHMQMIAIGGSIGAGLFVGSGSALSSGGPAALVIDFIIIGVMLLLTVNALGELAGKPCRALI
jgi:amino acid permease